MNSFSISGKPVRTHFTATRARMFTTSSKCYTTTKDGSIRTTVAIQHPPQPPDPPPPPVSLRTSTMKLTLPVTRPRSPSMTSPDRTAKDLLSQRPPTEEKMNPAGHVFIDKQHCGLRDRRANLIVLPLTTPLLLKGVIIIICRVLVSKELLTLTKSPLLVPLYITLLPLHAVNPVNICKANKRQ